jgi:D-arabinose 1-dehydrogenase-like Zn-dependent alcohol dehydrogenase
MARALAAVLEASRALRLREFSIPEIGPDAGILRIEACGLCGTDYAVARPFARLRRRDADHPRP